MKKIFSILLACMLLPATLSAKGYKISGNIKNAEGNTVILCKAAGIFGFQSLDSAVVKNGKFQISGTTNEPQLFYLRFFKDANRSIRGEEGLNEYPCIPLFIGNDKVTITADVDSLGKDFETQYYKLLNDRTTKVTGSKLNDEFTAYRHMYTDGYNNLSKVSHPYYKYLQEQNGKVSPMVGVNEAKKVLDARKSRSEAQKSFILSHNGDYVGMLAFSDGMGMFSKAEIEDIVNNFTPEIKSTAFGKSVIAKSDTVKSTARGAHFADYDITMADGSNAKLSDFLGKGNYTLLEFWASWCGPCRASIPHLKQLYGLYHPQGFDILSVSIDQDKNSWKKAMQQEGMKWHLAIPQGNPRNISKLYNFDGIPYCLLIDPKGNIVDTNTRDGFLDSYLVGIYGDKLDKLTVKGKLSDTGGKLYFSQLPYGSFHPEGKDSVTVAPDGSFEYTITLATPTQLTAYRPFSSSDSYVTGFTIPAIPGEVAVMNGSINDYDLSGSNFYEQYNEISKTMQQQNKSLMSFVEENDKLAKAVKAAKGKAAKAAAEKKLKAAQASFQTKYSEEVKNGQQMALDYIKQHPRSEASVAIVGAVNPDSLDTAIKAINRFIANGRMAPVIEAAKAAKKNEETEKAAKAAIKPGAEAPDFTLKTSDGSSLSLKDLRGKYVLLDFWGSWCGWCIKGIPDMKKAYEKHKDKAEFLSIDCNDSQEKWLNALEKYQMPWKQVKNETADGVPSKYAVQGYPTKILLNPDGTINFVFEGEDPDFYKKLDEALK